MQQQQRWVVSVESLDVPIRSSILKSLHAKLGMNVIADNERASSPFQRLLRRLRALSRMPSSTQQPVLYSGSWLLHAPTDPVMSKVYNDVGVAVADVLGVRHFRHLMVCMRTDVDEAFEHSLTSSTDVVQHLPMGPRGLQALGKAQDELLRPDRVASCTPLRSYVVTLECPAYAADTPAIADHVRDRVERAVRCVTEPIAL